MFAKIIEMSLSSGQNSSQSVNIAHTPPSSKRSKQDVTDDEKGEKAQARKESKQRMVPGIKHKSTVSDGQTTPHGASTAITEELESANRGSGVDNVLSQGRRVSIQSAGRKSPDQNILQQRRRSSPASAILHYSPSQPDSGHAIPKAAIGLSGTDAYFEQFQRRYSTTSTHSNDPYLGRRLSSSSFAKSLSDLSNEEERRQYMEQRRRPSRESRRRASLVLVGSNFRVGRRIGAGNFGEIRLGRNLYTDEPVAIKMEPMKARFSQLRREYALYKKLCQQPVEGLPVIYFWSTLYSYNALVMELLGPNLADLFELCNQKFSLKTVLMIALQTLRRIQFVHSRSIIYRDIKPENFVIGRYENKQHIIYLIDFGLAKEFIDPETQEHISYKENKGITGTARYISINVHQGREMSRRDDLEALGYMLLYFLKGRLPWQGQKCDTDVDTLKAVANIKMRTSIEELCRGCPPEFSVYLHYVRGLGFCDSPDYDFLRKLFHDLLDRMRVQCDWRYDWASCKLYVTPSGVLVTKLPENRIDVTDDLWADQGSLAEVRYQSNKALFSYENTPPVRDASQIMAGNPIQDPLYQTGIGDRVQASTDVKTKPKCPFCGCCGQCCFHRLMATKIFRRLFPLQTTNKATDGNILPQASSSKVPTKPVNKADGRIYPTISTEQFPSGPSNATTEAKTSNLTFSDKVPPKPKSATDGKTSNLTLTEEISSKNVIHPTATSNNIPPTNK